LQQRRKAAGTIQRNQLVAAAYMGVADEDLRHGTATGQRDHVISLHRVQVDPDFVNLLDAALFEQALGTDAVGADLGRVHADSVHGIRAAIVKEAKLLQVLAVFA